MLNKENGTQAEKPEKQSFIYIIALFKKGTMRVFPSFY
jgi:hypothetical protein